MKKIIIYHNWIPKVGGIETAVFTLAKLLSKKYDVTVAYRGSETLDTPFHYAEVARVVKLGKGVKRSCDIGINASNHELPKEISADRWLQWIHSDYEKYNLALLNKGKVEYVSVTNYVASVIKRLEDVESTVIYNVVDPDLKPRKVFKLVTVSRISPEKGFKRMLQMAEELKKRNLHWVWFVLGDNSVHPQEFEAVKSSFAHLPEVYFLGFKQDVVPIVQDADYLVQLSDWEGCPYSVLEALKLGVPCIVTDWGGADELIKEGKNGYIVDKKLRNLDLKKIIAEIPEVKTKRLSTIKDWERIIG